MTKKASLIHVHTSCMALLMTLIAFSTSSATLGSYSCAINNAETSSSDWLTIGTVERLPYSFMSWLGGTKQLTLVTATQNTDSQTISDIQTRLENSLYWVQRNYYLVSIGSPPQANLALPVFTMRLNGSMVSTHVETAVSMSIARQCAAWANCVEFVSNPSGIDYTFPMIAKIDNANYSFAPSIWEQKRVIDLPLPPNEYSEATYVFTGSAQATLSTSGSYNISSGPGIGDPVVSLNRVPQVTCSRAATPISLTLTPTEIKFDAMQTGSTTPVSKTLTWNANGTGQAPLWTIRFESANNTENAIMLGGARVTIKEENLSVVKPGVDMTITGNTGKYTFELDPTSGTPGDHASDVRVTLTAN